MIFCFVYPNNNNVYFFKLNYSALLQWSLLCHYTNMSRIIVKSTIIFNNNNNNNTLKYIYILIEFTDIMWSFIPIN